MAKVPHIEVILPVYNEEENIPVLIERLDTARKDIGKEATVSYLFVNDGSSDSTPEVLNRLHETRTDIRVIHLLHNFGHSAALACGVDHFDGDIAMVMDADLQDPPSAMKPMFESWKKGAVTVVAERGSRQEKTSILFNTFYFLLRKMAKNLPAINFGTHCMLDKSVMQRLRDLKERNRYFPGLVGYTSGPVEAIRLDRDSRAHGKSRVGIVGLINLAITAFLSFSNAPIRLVSFIGLACSAGAISGAMTIVCIKLFTTKAIPGWASTMSLLFFSSGLQLLCLGLLGEYVARIYVEVKQRPLYLVGEVLDPAEKAKSKRATVSSIRRSAVA